VFSCSQLCNSLLLKAHFEIEIFIGANLEVYIITKIAVTHYWSQLLSTDTTNYISRGCTTSQPRQRTNQHKEQRSCFLGCSGSMVGQDSPPLHLLVHNERYLDSVPSSQESSETKCNLDAANDHSRPLSLLFVACCRICSSNISVPPHGTELHKCYHNHYKGSRPVS